VTSALRSTVVAEPEYGALLLQRLCAAAQVLMPRRLELHAPDRVAVLADSPVRWAGRPYGVDESGLAGLLLDELVGDVKREPGEGRLWLLLTALRGDFPIQEDVDRARRLLKRTAATDAQYVLLKDLAEREPRRSGVAREMEVITDRPVVLVHFCAHDELMTGVQRVVRHTVPKWVDKYQLVLAGWTPEDTAMSRLTDIQLQRVLAWHERPADERAADDPEAARVRLIVPWRVPTLVPEVPFAVHSPRLACLGRESGSPLRIIGYDCIPLVGAELVSMTEHVKFMDYLNVVKYTETVAGISEAAAEEFGGFGDMIRAQGLPGPSVVACPLPTRADLDDEPASLADVAPEPGAKGPQIVCIGSIDRRKNQIVVLEAAERLWREGLVFSVRFLGSGGLAPADFTSWAQELMSAGRQVTIEHSVPDAVIGQAIRSARFTVFPSLQEGFGIPAIESLSLGVPVITSDRGSLREVVEGDGALLVDPTDSDSVTNAMRRLLTDDDLHAELVTKARTRQRTTWADYAESLWTIFTAADGSTR